MICLLLLGTSCETRASGGSDMHIYLWLKVPSTDHTTFKLDTMRVGNGTLLEEGDLEVIVSAELEL